MELKISGDFEYNAGTLTLDALTDGAPCERTAVFNNAAEADFDAQLEQLLGKGYLAVYDRRVEGQRYASLGKGGSYVHLSYYPAQQQLLVTEELNKLSVEDISYTSSETGGARFYMYGLNMDPGGYNPNLAFSADFNTSGFVNCGMILAMRATDGSLIVIDGGKASQYPNGALSTLNRFLHKIAGKPEGETVTVSAWFITHAHDDHYEGFAAMLAKFPEQYKLERILASFPERKVASLEAKFPPTVETVRTHFPDCIDYKLHTGDRITLGDVTLDVLYTHENTLDGEGKTLVEDFNDTTTVAVLEAAGMRVMILGDISELAEERLLSCYTKETLHTDIVQVAHHNFNHLVRIYEPISAPIACFTQTLEGTRKNESTRANAKPVLDTSSVFYYNGDITKTVGFGVKDGEVVQTFSYTDLL